MRLPISICLALVAPVALAALAPVAHAADDDAPATAAAPSPPDAPPARILHVPPGESPANAAIRLVAVIDASATEPVLVVRWRPHPTRGAAPGPWQEVPFERSSAGGFYATLPASAARPPGVDYYIVGVAPGSALTAPGRPTADTIAPAAGAASPGAAMRAHFASAAAPQTIAVVPTEIDRLEAQERVRTDDRADTVAVEVTAHDFGNRYAHTDRYARGELTWTHRFLRNLYSTGFGMGGISGTTPTPGGPNTTDQDRQGRYGFAEVRLRLHPSIFVDGRATLGVSHSGFLRGIGGAITFGKPWRSNLSVGGEALDDLGGSAYVRLQWDTAPPLLMGASIVRTDLPGALVSANGLFLRYDVTWHPGRYAVTAMLSYGARDGAAHFGGGVGTSVDF
ncbi:MAG: hypothetical protein K8W52_30945 [Deltaproteobacteria bacterium]|nr:hypothetical protein [Deltaproteobacteria bacterium]